MSVSSSDESESTFTEPRSQRQRTDAPVVLPTSRPLFNFVPQASTSDVPEPTAGPSRPTFPLAAPPNHVNRFDSEDNLVDQWGNVIDINSVQFQVSEQEQSDDQGLSLDVFNMSTQTQGLVRDIEQQQQRGEIEIEVF